MNKLCGGLLLLASVLTFTACAFMNGLEPVCKTTDEKSLGELYANKNVPLENFDIFAKQCAKYNYRVPSKEIFLASYNETKKNICASVKIFFKHAFAQYATGGAPGECASANSEKDLNREDIKTEAFNAYLLKDSIDSIDKKLTNNYESGNKKKYNKDPALDTFGRWLFESNPRSLEVDRKNKLEELKTIIKKYGFYVSDLEQIQKPRTW